MKVTTNSTVSIEINGTVHVLTLDDARALHNALALVMTQHPAPSIFPPKKQETEAEITKRLKKEWEKAQMDQRVAPPFDPSWWRQDPWAPTFGPIPGHPYEYTSLRCGGEASRLGPSLLTDPGFVSASPGQPGGPGVEFK